MMKSAIALGAVCALVFLIAAIFGVGQEALVAFVLPSDLEDVKAAADLIILPLQSILSCASALKGAAVAFLAFFGALFSLELVTAVKELLILLIAAVAVILHFAVFIVSVIPAFVAVVLGLVLAGLALLFGGFA